MSVEQISFAVGIGALALALKGAVDSALYVESFFDKDTTSHGYLKTCYRTERVWLQMWREECQLSEGDDGILREKPDYVKAQIIRVLQAVNDISEDAIRIVGKYELSSPETQGQNLGTAAEGAQSATPTGHGRRLTDLKPNSRFRWVAKGRERFETIIGRLRQQNHDLERLTLGIGERDGLAARVVAQLAEPSLAGFAQGSHIEPKTNIALAASAKSLRLSLENQTLTSTQLTGQQVRVLGPKDAQMSAPGMLSLEDGSQTPVWIEWVSLEPGQSSNTNTYISRINSLGGLLERVSNPVLRLLPCHGVFRDMEYQQTHGILRLGYVYGVPPDEEYEQDLLDNAPVSLRQLILESNDARARSRPPKPLLGDRFQLAYTLASSFALFHAAGWLHKGLHAGSITFLHKRAQRPRTNSISVTDPFVAGFQYSRPQAAESLSRGPLENKALEYYYHPDVDRGFTKRQDLYGLGIVLLEIGRWNLLAESVGERNRPEDREAWHRWVMKKAVPDMGWRMGQAYEDVVQLLLECRLPGDDHDEDFFFRQFQEKVLKPLSECRA